jgi:regulator of protease activity HflC (stomatin/prohibitin superfamily)
LVGQRNQDEVADQQWHAGSRFSMSKTGETALGEEKVVEPSTGLLGWRSIASVPFRWVERFRFQITLSLLIAAFLVAALWRDVTVSNHSGEQGVYWSRFFGGTSDRILGEGIHFKFPWDEIIVYNTRVMEWHGKTGMLTRDGMEINVEWSARYRVDPSRLPLLHRMVGPMYAEKVIVPEVISSIRQVLGNYTADQIYARDEVGLVQELDVRVGAHVREHHPLFLEKLVLTRLDLPPAMAKGIVDKLLFEQSLLAYRYRLQAEEEESKRKEVEAKGIKAFEQTSGISILKWRGIEATQDLAKSPNAKIIVMGTGQASLPVLLNADQAEAAVPARKSDSLPSSSNSASLPGPASGAK